ncbi:MAG: hypothetical protein Q8R91_04650 [Candidatus Omnitrophota bacterium]|nr:hypothetical protein [Candidatus Omnitrophota bacterium]
MGESLEDAEKKAAHLLLPELKDHLELIRGFMNLIGESGGVLPINECAQSVKVTSQLLIRLANDLRCVHLLAERGYHLQAWTIASSVYEVGITVAYIGKDEERAQKWIDHDKPDQPFLNLRTATIEAFKALGISDPENQAESDYRVYQWLCMGKHANPLLQKEYGLIRWGQGARLQNGPEETAVDSLWYAMDHAARYAYVALAAFAMSHLPIEQHNRIAERANALAAKREQLRITARQRWSGQDPFQEKWRPQRKAH